MKSIYPTLTNAPIEEAIIQVEVKPKETCLIEDIEVLANDIVDNSPSEINEWKRIESILNFDNEEIDTKRSNLGYKASSFDEKKVFHVGYNTLIFSLLKPYKNWDYLIKLYNDAWHKFSIKTNPINITKISLRFINKFEIPIKEWDSYILMSASLNAESEFDSSSISMGETMTRYNLKSDRYVAESVVVVSIKAINDDKLSVLLDIDVRSLDSINNYKGFHEIEDVLNRLREFKNQIFFSNLPKAKELFNE